MVKPNELDDKIRELNEFRDGCCKLLVEFIERRGGWENPTPAEKNTIDEHEKNIKDATYAIRKLGAIPNAIGPNGYQQRFVSCQLSRMKQLTKIDIGTEENPHNVEFRGSIPFMEMEYSIRIGVYDKDIYLLVPKLPSIALKYSEVTYVMSEEYQTCIDASTMGRDTRYTITTNFKTAKATLEYDSVPMNRNK